MRLYKVKFRIGTTGESSRYIGADFYDDAYKIAVEFVDLHKNRYPTDPNIRHFFPTSILLLEEIDSKVITRLYIEEQKKLQH